MSLLDNTQKKATAINAREMIIFSYPKVGKTELFTKLPGNYLILDFEGGTDFYDCNAVSIPNFNTFNLLRDEMIEKNVFYDFLVIDTITSLYNTVANAIAVSLYNKDEGKKKPLDWDISTLAYGLGYSYKRIAMQKVLTFFRQYCNCLILSGHVADRSIGSGEQLTVKDLDIEGKLKNILAFKTDAMALLQRTSKNENTLSFTTSTDSVNGTRIQHLNGKEILISKKLEDGSLETYWDKIFIKSN